MTKQVAGARVDKDTNDRLDVIAIRNGYVDARGRPVRSDVVRDALTEFLERHPVSDSELAQLRLTGGAVANDSPRADRGADVVPIAAARAGVAPVITRHEIVVEQSGEGGRATPAPANDDSLTDRTQAA